MPKQTRKPAAERKVEIVETAIRLAAEIGPDRLTTEKLAAAIGITQAAIFRHFSTKADIWEAVGRHIRDTMGAPPTQTMPPKDPADFLRVLVTSQLRFIKDTPAVPAILFSRELHSENETLRLIFVDLMHKRHQRLSGVIGAAINAGTFSEKLNPDDAAYLILSFIQGLAMRWSLDARSFDLVAEGDRLFDQVLAGFIAP